MAYVSGTRRTLRLAMGSFFVTGFQLRLLGSSVVTFVGSGAGTTIEPAMSTEAVTLQVLDSHAFFRDLTLRGSTFSQSVIACGAGEGFPTSLRLLRASVRNGQGTGIDVQADCPLVVERSLIGFNNGLGIRAASPFRIENSYIVSNFGGGISIPIFGGVFRNNTVTKNRSSVGVPSGVACSSGIVPAAVYENNIVYGNTGGPNWGVTPPSAGAGCEWRFSDIDAPGVGNINMDPLFVDPTSAFYVGFKIQSSSPARNAGSNAAAPPVDYDGDARPEGTSVDMGADEFYP